MFLAGESKALARSEPNDVDAAWQESTNSYWWNRDGLDWWSGCDRCGELEDYGCDRTVGDWKHVCVGCFLDAKDEVSRAVQGRNRELRDEARGQESLF